MRKRFKSVWPGGKESAKKREAISVHFQAVTLFFSLLEQCLANAAHLHEEPEKAEQLEKQRNEIERLLQQHQEEKEDLKEAHQAETKRLSQDIKIQVG